MSEVKVNKISPRTNCGTVTVGDSGDSVSVAAGVPVTVNGDLKSNALKATDGGSIISQCGTTITLGASGDSITLASGASQTGFGRTGTVDWQTGSIKTATFTAANGEGYFANTSGGTFTMNLPAGTAGNIVSVVDYTNTFQTNALTVAPNGSQKIGGIAASNTLSTEGQSVTFVYVDDTEGWKNIQDSTSNVTGNPFLLATGGTITTCGNCKIHTFTGPGTFTVCKASSTAPENIVSYLVIGGAGGGGDGAGGIVKGGGGGGAGGYREVKNPITPYTASPLDGYPSAPNRVTVTAQAYPITVGAGGGSNNPGSNTVALGITSAAGGKGGPGNFALTGDPGGSGGGANTNPGPGAAGNTPPVSPPQGNDGGAGSNPKGGGGGGAGGSGTPGSSGGGGGSGTSSNITGSPVPYVTGGSGTCCSAGAGSPQPANSGKGGPAGGFPNNAGGTGGSGIVVIRYKFQ
jgi:hypothetical protein